MKRIHKWCMKLWQWPREGRREVVSQYTDLLAKEVKDRQDRAAKALDLQIELSQVVDEEIEARLDVEYRRQKSED